MDNDNFVQTCTCPNNPNSLLWDEVMVKTRGGIDEACPIHGNPPKSVTVSSEDKP
jgi:hypothetical protein